MDRVVMACVVAVVLAIAAGSVGSALGRDTEATARGTCDKASSELSRR